MKKSWQVKKLGEIIESNVIGLIRNTKEQSPDFDYKYVKMNNITRENGFDLSSYTRVNATKEETKKYSLRCGDFLFNTRNSFELVGKTCVYFGDNENLVLYNNNIMRIRFIKSINPKFINYSFSTKEIIENLTALKSGTTNVSAIYYKDLQHLKLPIPPLSEQELIVSILDEAFAAIDQAKENVQRNLQNAKELFKSELNSIFANKGESWEEKTLNQISTNLDSKRIPITKNVRSNGEYPYYGASGIVDYVSEYIFDENLLLVSEDGANLLARTYPIAFSISGKAWVNNHAHVLKFDNLLSQHFVEYYLNSIKLDKYVSGMAQPKLNQKMLNTIPIPYPSIDIQERLVNRLDKISDELNKLEVLYQQKLNTLEELKKSILQRAFNGELSTSGLADVQVIKPEIQESVFS
jgi:type I restriction enzyme S subunit